MVTTRSAAAASEASEASSTAPLASEDAPTTSEDTAQRKKAPPSSPDGELRTRTALLLLVLIFASSFTAMCLVYYSFPNLET